MICTGDLLLCSGAEPVSRIIQAATRSPYSHVALVVRMLSIDRILLLEVEWPYGVRGVALSSYFKDWNGSGKAYSGHLLVARHARFDECQPRPFDAAESLRDDRLDVASWQLLR